MGPRSLGKAQVADLLGVRPVAERLRRVAQRLSEVADRPAIALRASVPDGGRERITHRFPLRRRLAVEVEMVVAI